MVMSKKEVPLIEAKKTAEKDVVLDDQGFVVIEVYEEKIHVEYYTNVIKGNRIVSGNLQKIFIGNKANALSDTFAKHVSNLRAEHYLYIGRELQKAQRALEKKEPYTQGGC
jgi:hypothetical protein